MRVTFYQAVGGWIDMPSAELEAAYKSILISSHPDAHVGESSEALAEYAAAFARATEAWSVLGTRVKRAQYDKLSYVLGKACPDCRTKGFVRARTKKWVPDNRKQCERCGGTGYELTALTTPEARALS